MAKIESTADLPVWFSLEKYQGTKDFSAAEWLTALAIRQDILSTVVRRNDSEEGAYDYQCLAPHLEALRRAPLKHPSDHYLWQHIPARGTLAKLSPVRHLTMQDMAWQAFEDRGRAETDHRARQLADRWQAIVGDDLFEQGLIEQDDPLFMDYRGEGAPVAAVRVDLAAQDSVLLEAFSIWLKTARDTHQAARRERPAYHDWSRYGLLPYIDLLIWTYETGNQIPHNFMAQAVGYFRGGDSFRKTVPGLAKNLMLSTLAELEALAALEVAQEIPGA